MAALPAGVPAGVAAGVGGVPALVELVPQVPFRLDHVVLRRVRPWCGVPGASYRVPISGQPGTRRTARTAGTTATTEQTAVVQNQPVNPVSPVPRPIRSSKELPAVSGRVL